MDYRRRPSRASAGVSRTAQSAPQTRNTGCNADGAQNDVTVKVDGIAASAASVIAMAGTRVLMSPVSTMMIHNPLTVAMGDSDEMRPLLIFAINENLLLPAAAMVRPKTAHKRFGETSAEIHMLASCPSFGKTISLNGA